MHVCVDTEQEKRISSSQCDAHFTYEVAQLTVYDTRCLEQREEPAGFIYPAF